MVTLFTKVIRLGVFLSLMFSTFSIAEAADNWYAEVQQAESAMAAEPQRHEKPSESRQESSTFKETTKATTVASASLNALKEAAETELQREIAYQESAIQAIATTSVSGTTTVGVTLSMESPSSGRVGAASLGDSGVLSLSDG